MQRRNFIAAATVMPSFALESSNRKGEIRQGRENIPDLAITDQTGRKHHFYRDLVKDKMVVINFFYADCTGICPRMTSNLLKVQRGIADRMGDRLGRDIFMYSVSLKPEEDTPKR